MEDEIISVNIQVMNGVTVKDLTFRPMLTHVDTEGDFSPYHKNTYPIPQAILDLDGYGDGVSDDVHNYVDWENKEYHKRVGKVDLGTLPWENYQENVNAATNTTANNFFIFFILFSSYSTAIQSYSLVIRLLVAVFSFGV